MGTSCPRAAPQKVPVEVWEGRPLGMVAASLALGRCAGRAVLLVARGRIRQPRGRGGERWRFADGTGGTVYRETVLDRPAPCDPAVLVVAFRLRGVRGAFGHALFRCESLLNTGLFVGFPGFVAKLWFRHDEQGRYRGVYEWDGAASALAYVRALARVLGLVSATGTVRAVVLPGIRLASLLADPAAVAVEADLEEGTGPWWRLVGPEGTRR